jgi:hypothetical protein
MICFKKSIKLKEFFDIQILNEIKASFKSFSSSIEEFVLFLHSNMNNKNAELSINMSDNLCLKFVIDGNDSKSDQDIFQASSSSSKDTECTTASSDEEDEAEESVSIGELEIKEISKSLPEILKKYKLSQKKFAETFLKINFERFRQLLRVARHKPIKKRDNLKLFSRMKRFIRRNSKLEDKFPYLNSTFVVNNLKCYLNDNNPSDTELVANTLKISVVGLEKLLNTSQHWLLCSTKTRELLTQVNNFLNKKNFYVEEEVEKVPVAIKRTKFEKVIEETRCYLKKHCLTQREFAENVLKANYKSFENLLNLKCKKLKKRKTKAWILFKKIVKFLKDNSQ